MKSWKILFIASSHNKMGDTISRTGVWLEELASPYYVFKDAGAALTVASPQGGAIPLEPKSQSTILSTQNTKRFLKDGEAADFISNTLKLDGLNTDDFDAVYLPGGHGCLWDLVEHIPMQTILNSFNKLNKPIGAVSQGVAGLLNLVNEKKQLRVDGCDLTCFSDAEEASAGLTAILPFSLEKKLQALGALFTKGADYVSHVVKNGNIITGQNPASAGDVAKSILLLLKERELSSSQPIATKIA